MVQDREGLSQTGRRENTAGRDGPSHALPRRVFLGLGMAGALGGLLLFPVRSAHPRAGSGGRGQSGREIGLFLRNRDALGLSQEQVKRLREIQDAAQESVKGFTQQVRRLEKRISEEMGKDTIDLARIEALAGKIGKIEAEKRLEPARAL
ncbi:MAG TPA: periplasmic heavy metal sensor, partial [Nitrospiria bacterium]